MKAPSERGPLAGWGNPFVESFARKLTHIELQGKRIRVHRSIAPLVSQMLAEAVDAGVGLDGRLSAYKVAKPGQPVSEENLGLAIRCSVLEGYYEKWLFEQRGALLVFAGLPEDAAELCDRAECSRIKLVSGIPEREWKNHGPGLRVLREGDKGDDVVFFQLAVGCPENSGTFGEITGQYARQLNIKFGLPAEPAVTDSTWKPLLPQPNRANVCSRGDVGLKVRALQAALVAYDWDNNLPISGRFDRLTEDAVRRLQYACGLRNTGRVHSPEWSAALNRNLYT